MPPSATAGVALTGKTVPVRNQTDPRSQITAEPFCTATCSAAAKTPNARTTASESTKISPTPRRFGCTSGTRNSRRPTARNRTRFASLPANAENALRKMSTGAGVAVVSRISRVPVCCASCTVLREGLHAGDEKRVKPAAYEEKREIVDAFWAERRPDRARHIAESDDLGQDAHGAEQKAVTVADGGEDVAADDRGELFRERYPAHRAVSNAGASSPSPVA